MTFYFDLTIVYNPENPTTYSSNSILQSQDKDNAIVDKVSPLAVGLKVKISLGAGKTVTTK